MHRLDEAGAQNRRIRLINKAAAGRCLQSITECTHHTFSKHLYSSHLFTILYSLCPFSKTWYLDVRFIKKCSARTQACRKVLVCLCAASASHFRPGQAAVPASLPVSKLTSRTIEIQVLGLSPGMLCSARRRGSPPCLCPRCCLCSLIWTSTNWLSQLSHWNVSRCP